MPDYANGKIYMICSNDGDMELVYYGSTCCLLSKRMAKHRSDYKDPTAGCRSRNVFDKYGMANCHIELLKLHPCNSRAEIERAENEYIRNNKCVNYQGTRGSTTDRKSYMKKNNSERYIRLKETLSKQHKEWRDIYKDEINEKKRIKVACECGKTICVGAMARHRRTQHHQNYLSSI